MTEVAKAPQVPTSKRAHGACSHAKYRMTCQQYDDLRDAANGRCQICGQIERYAPGARLQTDHEKSLGYWAVRGLLCVPCNVNLGHGNVSGPEVDRYLANPWYQSLPYAHLIDPEASDDGPILEAAVALDLVARAAQEAASAKTRKLTGWRDLRRNLLDMVRLAHRSGARQVDIVQTSGKVLSGDDVYRAICERRQQPEIPVK